MVTNQTVTETLPVYLDPTRNDYWNNRCDPRTVHLWLLADGPWKLLTFTLVYLLIVLTGPRLMRSRKPYELRMVMLIYNTAMVLANAYFLIRSLIWLKFGYKLTEFNFPSQHDRSDDSMMMIEMFHLYVWTKFVDYLDTFFFILRKKQSQLTFLHIYHHASVPTFGWISIWINPTMPALSLFMILNGACHVMMYSYYALASFGPQIQPYLWWKRYITQTQIVQFVIIAIYGTLLNQYHRDYPLLFRALFLSQAVLFFVMFAHFYVQAYIAQRSLAETDNNNNNKKNKKKKKTK